MKDYQIEFIEFAISAGVLCFGEFQLKSGRISPYFFNIGQFNTGGALSRLGVYYARAIEDSGIAYDMIFGPAYKGIPLVAATAVALAERHGRDVPYAFNRKEAKDHAEGGVVVGAPLGGRVLIIDDVISSGMSVDESVAIVLASDAIPAGVAISLDRQERGAADASAVQEVEHKHGIPVVHIVGLDDVIAYLEGEPRYGEALAGIRDYRTRYGAPTANKQPDPRVSR